jgi:hypothetical protein
LGDSSSTTGDGLTLFIGNYVLHKPGQAWSQAIEIGKMFWFNELPAIPSPREYLFAP